MDNKKLLLAVVGLIVEVTRRRMGLFLENWISVFTDTTEALAKHVDSLIPFTRIDEFDSPLDGHAILAGQRIVEDGLDDRCRSRLASHILCRTRWETSSSIGDESFLSNRFEIE